MSGQWAVLITVVLLMIAVLGSVRIVVIKQYERIVVLRLGKYNRVTGPGARPLLRFIEEGHRVDLRDQKINLSALDVVTADNFALRVQASVGYHVTDPARAYFQVADLPAQLKDLSETELQHVVGQKPLNEILQDREDAAGKLVERINTVTEERWGSKLFRVSLEQIDPPPDIGELMAAKAIAEREAEAQVIRAEASIKAARSTAEAAAIIDAAGPTALSLTQIQMVLQAASFDSNSVLLPANMGNGAAEVAAAVKAATEKPPRRRSPSKPKPKQDSSE